MPFARYFCIFINVGLGEGAPAIGVPFFWPSAAMPNTVIDSWSSMVFLKFNGAKFSATDYPVLAKVFPALALPDARGDFIRIWDDGRGIDVGRIGFVAVRVFMCFHTATGSRTFFFNLKRHAAK